MRIKSIYAALLLILVSSCYADEQYAMVRDGAYLGLQLGYLDAHYSDSLDRYSAGSGNQEAAGSNFAFHGFAGYNFNDLYGAEIGVMQYQDSSDGSTATITRKASINLLIVNAVATFHLKLNDERSWVGTPKVGLALERGKLNYQYIAPSGNSPWEGGNNVNNTQTKVAIVPTAGISFDHSFNSHLVMSFGYQYYFGGFANYNDPYQTSVSSIHYFNVGGTYKF